MGVRITLNADESILQGIKNLIKLPDRIGIIGPAGSGKTTFAKEVQQECGHRIQSLADEIKRIVSISLGRPLDKGKDRHLLQKVGQTLKLPIPRSEIIEALPEINQGELETILNFRDTLLNSPYDIVSLWALFIVKDLQHNKVVIDDIRFPHEAECLKEAGFLLLSLKVSKEKRLARLVNLYGSFDQGVLDHISEVLCDSIKADIVVKGV